jgi:uncharacterized protein (TIGR02145 family)
LGSRKNICFLIWSPEGVGNDNNSNIADTFRRLYNWYAVSDNSNIAPTGWHIPSDDEWTKLTSFLGGDSIAVYNLKESGTGHWTSIDNISVSTNESGFTPLPGGFLGKIVFAGAEFGYNYGYIGIGVFGGLQPIP